jgi:hypothetical protein
MNSEAMKNISLSEVLRPQDGVWDYVLYIIIFLQIILLALLFLGSLRDVMLMAASVLAAIADKIYLFGFMDGGATNIDQAVAFHTKESFFTYAARVIIFAFPFVVTTQTKIRRAKPLCVILGITGLVYMFARWFFQQYPEGEGDFRRPGMIVQEGMYFVQAGTMYLVLLDIALRTRWTKK